MVDFKNAVNEVKIMANAKMSFGHYGASVKNMDNVYVQRVNPPRTEDVFGTEIQTESASYSSNGKSVAVATKHSEGDRVNYGIFDNNTRRTYSSGWQDTKKSDKLNYIAFGEFAIEDTNGNGKVDDDDKVYANDASGTYMFVKDILSGNFKKIFNDKKQ